MRLTRPIGRPGPTRRQALVMVGGAALGLGAVGGVVATRQMTHGRAVAEPLRPWLAAPPVDGVALHPAAPTVLQGLTHVPQTGEWFTTQAVAGSSGFVDAAGLDVGDIVVSRLSADGALQERMTLPDAGHGMGLVVRMEESGPVVTSCWFAPGSEGRTYDVVRLPFAAGTAERAAATTVVPGLGYPLDPSYDATTDTVTLRHQGGLGPQYTRHRWNDFVASDLTRPTATIATPDWPPTQQGFCSLGDRFFFYTGASSTTVGGDPWRLTEYSWTTGRQVAPALDVSRNARSWDGTYPGGRAEPEGAAILVDRAGAASLVLGVSLSPQTGPRTYPTFRYPLART